MNTVSSIRTHHIRKAIGAYATSKLGNSMIEPSVVQSDVAGWITDFLVDLYHLDDEEHFNLPSLLTAARKQAEKEGAGK